MLVIHGWKLAMRKKLVDLSGVPSCFHVLGGVFVARENGEAMNRALRILLAATRRIHVEEIFGRTLMEKELRDAPEVARIVARLPLARDGFVAVGDGLCHARLPSEIHGDGEGPRVDRTPSVEQPDHELDKLIASSMHSLRLRAIFPAKQNYRIRATSNYTYENVLTWSGRLWLLSPILAVAVRPPRAVAVIVALAQRRHRLVVVAVVVVDPLPSMTGPTSGRPFISIRTQRPFPRVRRHLQTADLYRHRTTQKTVQGRFVLSSQDGSG